VGRPIVTYSLPIIKRFLILFQFNLGVDFLFLLFRLSIHFLFILIQFLIQILRISNLQAFKFPFGRSKRLLFTNRKLVQNTKLCGGQKSPPDCLESIQIKSAADPITPLLMTPPLYNFCVVKQWSLLWETLFFFSSIRMV
jgi:hypothetical protein